MKTDRMFRRLRPALCLLCALCLLFLSAAAEVTADRLPDGLEQVGVYLTCLNTALTEAGEQPVNSLFNASSTLVILGITDADDAEVPEGVEMDITVEDGRPVKLVLRVSDPDRFAAVAGACMWAAGPSASELSEEISNASTYAAKAKAHPSDSFEDTVSELAGDAPRAYYAYYPNQYHDGVSWLQMTLIFSSYGLDGAGVSVTAAPVTATPNGDYEGYSPKDDYTHIEIFTTATPEPDSPANWYGM